MSKVDFKVEEGALKVGIDTNEDGQSSISVKLHLTEAIQEAFLRGGKIEGAKVVDFEVAGSKLLLKLDTDQDGQELLELVVDLTESFDEVSSAVAAKPEA